MKARQASMKSDASPWGMLLRASASWLNVIQIWSWYGLID